MTKPGIAYDTLIKGGSRATISKNIATERRAGKPERQSVAIAYSVAREARKAKK